MNIDSTHRSNTPSRGPAARPRLALPLMCFLLSTLVWTGLLLLLQRAIGLDGTLVFIGQFGPVLGAATTALCLRRSWRALAPDRIGRRQFVAHAVLAVAAMALYAVGLWAFATLLDRPAESSPFSGGMIAVFVVLQLLGALGEEAGWRGFLQPAFETRMPRFAATMVTGVIWAVWHVQNLADPVYFLWFLVSCLGLSVLFGYLANGDRVQRTVVAGVLHWLVNLSIFFLIAIPETPALDAWPLAVVPVVVATLFYAAFRAAQARRARDRVAPAAS